MAGGQTFTDVSPVQEFTDVSPTEETSTGIRVPKGMIAPPLSQDDSVLGGALRRGKETIRGVVGLFGAPTEEETAKGQTPQPLHRLARGLAGAEKEAAGQVKEQAKGAVSAYKAGDPIAAGLRGLQTATTGLSMLDPFAIGAVTNVNKLSGQKRYKEALGQGAFDAITLLAGKKMELTPEGRVNKLSFASDAAPHDIAHVLPDLQETAKKLGKPETVGDLGTHIQSTLTRLDQQFNSALFRNAHRQVSTQSIADALKSRATDMPPSPEGIEMAQQLNKAAAVYDGKTWALRDLNAERMMRSGFLKGFYKQGGSGQMSALRTSADTIIDKIVEGGAKDILYDELDRLNPGVGFKALKQKQSSLIDIKDAFDAHLDKIEKSTAQYKGAPLLDKVKISAVGTASRGLHPFVHQSVKGGNLVGKASSVARSAYGPATSPARAAVLSAPVSALVSRGQSALPPPPPKSDEQ